MKAKNFVIGSFAAAMLAGAAPASAGPFDILLSGYFDTTSAQDVEPQGIPFNRNLHSAYMDVQQNMYGSMSEQFNRKARSAGRGIGVEPESPFNWQGFQDNPDQADPFLVGRQELISAFDRGGREVTPAEAATAQAQYDCWVAFSGVATLGATGRAGDAHECYIAFLDALDQVGGDYKLTEVVFVERAKQAAMPAMEPAAYLVYFEFDSTEITTTGRAALDQAKADIRANRPTSIALIGHADLTGPPAHNMALSERRARRVRDELVADGVPSGNISTNWVGDTQPLVPTPRGVREQGNRVVEVNLLQ